MKKIAEIVICNFQSHVKTTIKTASGLNVITGANDSGKTAVMRAVRWVAFNEPSGDAFVTALGGTKASETSVKITTTDGSVITKTRKGRKTSYTINGEIFIQAEPPVELSKALGLEKKLLWSEPEELNFSYQLDAPFVLSLRPKDAVTLIGTISGAEKINKAIEISKRQMYEKNAEMKITLKSHEEINRHLDLYKNAEQDYEKAVDADVRLDLIKHKMALVEKMNNLKSDYSEISCKILQYQDIILKETQKLLAENLLSAAISMISKFNELRNKLYLYNNINRAIETQIEIIRKTAPLCERRCLFSQINVAYSKLVQCLQLSQNYRQTCDNAERQKIKLAQSAKVVSLDSQSATISALSARLNNLIGLKKLYNDAVLREISLESQFKNTVNIVELCENRLLEIWSENGYICPLCQNYVEKNNIRHNIINQHSIRGENE